MLSLIIRSYNNSQFLGRAIRSCLNQTIKVEVVVVDDASTDDSKEIIKSFGDKIVAIFLEKNVGVAEAANVGIRNSLGKYVMLVDSDDYIAEITGQFLSEILERNSDIGFVYGDLIRVDEKDKFLERINLDSPSKIFRHGAGIMFRKEYLEALGLYDTMMRNAEDHELLSRYIKNFDGYHLRLPLYRYSKHLNNITNNEEERKKWEQKIR